MFFFAILCNVHKEYQDTQLPGEVQANHSGMDFFMALFMVCAIEVVVVKILLFEESQNESGRTAASLFFETE